jgi:L-ascorbate metabolism protein UlaG (beta-lactamase superfamily)
MSYKSLILLKYAFKYFVKKSGFVFLSKFIIMEIEFVNHSSFIVRHDGIVLMIDPWIEGRVFNNGWELLSKTVFEFEDFSSVTHIWFSHEHPDHFFPPNIARIPEEYRKKITVLFQVTVDKRVVSHCKKVGFKEVIEMHPNEHIQLSPDVSVLCEQYQEGDSWLALKTKDLTLFNTNDCGIRDKNDALKIQKKVGKVDVLLTQFSYAYWAANRDEVTYRRKIADEKLEGLKFQIEMFQPKILIPIASYIWFCHEENFYLNDEVNRSKKVYDFVAEKTSARPVVLYRGDRYIPNQDFDSKPSIQRYNEDFVRILKGENLVKTVQVSEPEMLAQGKAFIENLKVDFGVWTKLLSPTNIWVTDYNRAYELSLEKGLVPTEKVENLCDASLSAESLVFNFKFPWGTIH